MNKLLKYSLVGVSTMFLMTGCSTRLGNMTVMSTNNVDGLHTEVTTKQRVSGESCVRYIAFIPFGSFQNRLQIATDRAIDNGHKKGLIGDSLINVKIDLSSWTTFIYGQDCVIVKGDLIPLNKSMGK